MDLPLDQQNIIGLLGIQDLPDERKIALVEKVTTLVEKRLMLRIFDSLSKPDQDSFAAMLDKQDQPEVNAFLATKAPKLADWMQEEVVKIKQELAESVKDIE